MGRVVDREEALQLAASARAAGKRVVFTNGCFDILHRGHVDLLNAARARGDLLVVGVNVDASVRRLKGPDRPWMEEADRAAVLAGLASVDLVVLFPEDTPLDLIRSLHPDVLVKGGDYRAEDVVGGELVTAHGGTVVIVPVTPGRSSSELRARMNARAGEGVSGEGDPIVRGAEAGPQGRSVDTPKRGLIA